MIELTPNTSITVANTLNDELHSTLYYTACIVCTELVNRLSRFFFHCVYFIIKI